MMSQCKREGCSRPAKGRGLFCSGACRVAHHRAGKKPGVTELPSIPSDNVTVDAENVTESASSVTKEAEGRNTTGPNDTENRVESPETRANTISDKCYNRPAVSCSEFGSRPSPLDPLDVPKPHNRGMYTRPDCSVYLFDCVGKVHERSSGAVPHPGRVASSEDYQENTQDYAFRACAELLNWGAPMSADELKRNRYSANRVSLPGDWDYVVEAVA